MSSSKRLWALIIGIDEYKDDTLTNLNGAVRDAQTVCSFLKYKMGVPERQICMLTNQQATLDNIITEIEKHFIENPDVHARDRFLFYFAGYGSRYFRFPNGTKLNESWEAICPSDRHVEGHSGAMVCDISDMVLAQLLTVLKVKKGDDITVIMDCCHAGDGGKDHAGRHVRYAPPMQEDGVVSEMVQSSHSRSILDLRLRGADLSTHVLLSACRQDEQAYEDTTAGASSGLFTSALLNKLNEDPFSPLTYDNLISQLLSNVPDNEDELSQHPQCEGKNTQRATFHRRFLGLNQHLLQISSLPDERLCIEAGSIHGIAVGAEFNVWAHMNDGMELPCGKLIATEVFSVYSLVEAAEHGFIPQHGWFASVSWWANTSEMLSPVRVAFKEETAQDECQRMLVERMQLIKGTEVTALLVPEKPSIPLISVCDGIMKVQTTDPLMDSVKTQIPCPSPWEGLEWLNRILRFELHLARTNARHPLLDGLDLSFVRAGASETTVSDNLFDDEHRVILQNDDASYYNLIVTNKNSRPLWISIYFFRRSTYTVTELYTPRSNRMKPPLEPNSKLALILAIGSANQEVNPFSFVVKEGLEAGSGFAKIFVSETYADLAMLQEQDDFIYVDPPEIDCAYEHSEHWDSIVTTITIRERGIDCTIT